MKLTLIADGSKAAGGPSTLIVHNERLADPLDEFTRAIGGISKRRNKTEADHEEIGRLEFYGGLYTNPMIPSPADLDGQEIVLPAWNILRCLQGGATRQKRGKDVLRGIYPLIEFAPLTFDGPVGIVERWQEDFWLRKTVGVQRSRTVRTRGIFTNWGFELPVEVDPIVFDVHTIRKAWQDAGIYEGLGEMRPVYGRFGGTVKVNSKSTEIEADNSKSTEIEAVES
jgi:hypothetical protein